MNKADLTGKVAIITGGGGGIGSATALRLAQAGASVAVADLFKASAMKTVDVLSQQGLKAAAFQADMANLEDVSALVVDTVKTFGRVDIVHNNAVLNDPEIYQQDRSVVEMNVEHWDKIFAVNVRGPMLLCKFAIPHMIEQGGGAIVNMSSLASQQGQSDSLTAYGATKGALNTLTLYTAAQYGAQNIRCNALVCGAVLTQGLKNLFSADRLESMAKRNRMGRWTTAEDIAALVHFLASDDARQITGQLYPI